METKMKSRSKALKQKVKDTQLYKGLNAVQKELLRTAQNIIVIERGLFILSEVGVKQWSTVTRYSQNNDAVIRELYANSLEVKF